MGTRARARSRSFLTVALEDESTTPQRAICDADIAWGCGQRPPSRFRSHHSKGQCNPERPLSLSRIHDGGNGGSAMLLPTSSKVAFIVINGKVAMSRVNPPVVPHHSSHRPHKRSCSKILSTSWLCLVRHDSIGLVAFLSQQTPTSSTTRRCTRPPTACARSLLQLPAARELGR